MVAVYSISLIISICGYFWLYITDVKKSLCQNVMMIIMIISNAGYIGLVTASSLGEALLAQKLAYLGGCFLPMLYYFTVCEMCHFELNRVVSSILMIIQAAIYAMTCTVGITTWYYSEVSFTIENGMGQLHRLYGPAHFIYPADVLLYFVVVVITGMGAAQKRKKVNKKELRNMVIAAAIAVFSYFSKNIFGSNYDFAPIGYLFLVFGAMTPIYRSNLYTVYENKKIVHEELDKIGFITFNNKMEFMSCNDFAENIFQELKTCKVGRRIEKAGPELASLINDVVDSREKLTEGKKRGHRHIEFNKFSVNDHFYESELHTVNDYRDRIKGYNVKITDETEHYKVIELTTKYNENLTREVAEKTERIREIQTNTILGMAQMVESRDLSTGGHIKRTSDVVKIFSKKLLEEEMGFDQRFLHLVRRAAPMHDLGKIGVDDAILRKNGKFTDEEYEQMKKHAAIGGEMVKDILSGVEEEDFVQIAENVAHYHHEKVNGMGYPDGLEGDNIPVEARIMALADVFDALVSKRCYKDSFSYDKAFSIIKEDAGSHFDEKLAEIFLSCRLELEEYYNNCEH